MRLINADKIHPDVRTQHGALAISQGQLAYAETVNAIPIPEDATNGDVIKAMFPKSNIEYWAEYSTYNVEFPNDNDVKHFSYDWWNAKYKGVE